MIYSKLVRDRIPDIIKQDGDCVVCHIASPGEMRARLADKLYEEVREFLNSWNPEELADISEVVRALSIVIDSSPDQVESLRREKELKRGGFTKRIVLDEVR